jgi:DNA polymerase epsilon subunit 1
MKIVTIPAALQKCLNPVPRIQYPEWLHKRIKAEDDKYKQKDMKHFFTMASKKEAAANVLRDIEDFTSANPIVKK